MAATIPPIRITFTSVARTAGGGSKGRRSQTLSRSAGTEPTRSALRSTASGSSNSRNWSSGPERNCAARCCGAGVLQRRGGASFVRAAWHLAVGKLIPHKPADELACLLGQAHLEQWCAPDRAIPDPRPGTGPRSRLDGRSVTIDEDVCKGAPHGPGRHRSLQAEAERQRGSERRPGTPAPPQALGRTPVAFLSPIRKNSLAKVESAEGDRDQQPVALSSATLPTGTFRRILKQAGLNEDEFRSR